MAEGSIAADGEIAADTESERPAARLILASEALREDLAPIEPGSRRGRLVVGGVALALALLGLAMWRGNDPNLADSAASGAFAAAGVAGALAVLPLPYSLRAMAILVLGTGLMALGAGNMGPLAGIRLGSSAAVESFRLVALSVLPGALLFRARYRAYARARIVLGGALLAALPFVAARVFALAGPAADLADRAGAAVDVAVILAGLFGFMGADTTGGSSVWAALVLAILPADVALRDLDTLAVGQWLAHVGASLGTMCAATLAAIGQYHLLSCWFSGDARQEAKKRDGDATLA